MNAQVSVDPWILLRDWLPANEEEDRPQITLCTIDEQGFPDSRTVLMSSFDDEGFYFHTDVNSRKASAISMNPRVSITVLWPGFTRQLVIQGLAETATAESITEAFSNRSPYLRQLSWLNTADYAQLPLEDRLARWGAFLAEHPDGPREQSAGWTGFLVRPTRLTFWVSHPDAASIRTEYTLGPDGWTRDYLPG